MMRLVLVTAVALSGAAIAQPMPMPPAPANSPSAAAFKAANDKMMANMSTPLTGDADRDFVAGMLPHHEGAVDMARVELQYGHDPALRSLAQSIIKTQEREIGLMAAWQQAHPAP